MQTLKGKTLYFAFIAEAMNADERLRAELGKNLTSVAEAVELSKSRVCHVDSVARALSAKLGIQNLEYGPEDPMTATIDTYNQQIKALNDFWDDGNCDLEQVSLSMLLSEWGGDIEKKTTMILDILKKMEGGLVQFPERWHLTLENCKVELLEWQVLEQAEKYHAAETLLTNLARQWREILATKRVSMGELLKFFSQKDMKKLERSVVSAEQEQKTLCENALLERERVEEERRQLEAERKRLDAERRQREKHEREEAEREQLEAIRLQEVAARKEEERNRKKREREEAERERLEAISHQNEQSPPHDVAETSPNPAPTAPAWPWPNPAPNAPAWPWPHDDEDKTSPNPRSINWGKMLSFFLSFAISFIVIWLYIRDQPTSNGSAGKPNAAWLSGALYGNDNEAASLRSVRITEKGAGYSVFITNQFGFNCRIEFDSKGDPARLLDCRGETGSGWKASTKVIMLKCDANAAERVCRGEYKLTSPDGGYSSVTHMVIARKK